LQSHDLVPESSRPFWNRKVHGGKTETEEADDDRERFDPADVVRLWKAAEAKGDFVLATAIKLAAYTGARREGICTLKVSSVRSDPDTKIRFLSLSEKTTAGKRDVPIHSAVAIAIDELVRAAGKDGWLIASDENKYGTRGDAIGKRFTRLKTDMGFGNRHVFHSIRHTVAHLLESAECPENVAKDVVGHVKQSMTYGLYSGVTKLDLRAKWIEKAIMYPVA
jgi:integrase